jgi:hypothetical protein
MTLSSYSMVPRATFTIVDFNTNRRTVLDSDGNLITTNIDPEEFEFEPNNDLEQNDLKKIEDTDEDSENLKLRKLVVRTVQMY